MKIGIPEILAVLCVIFFLFAAVGVFLFGMWTNSLYTKEYVQAQGFKLTERWIWPAVGTAIGGFVIAFFVWFLAKYLSEWVREKNLDKDERERMIRTRSTMMAYSILMVVLCLAAMYELLIDGPAKNEMYWLMIFALLLNGFCLALNKYILR